MQLNRCLGIAVHHVLFLDQEETAAFRAGKTVLPILVFLGFQNSLGQKDAF